MRRIVLSSPFLVSFYLFISLVWTKKTTITGQNIINIRNFNLQSPKTFDFLGAYKSERDIPSYYLPEIAFVGRSNVGKSSLLNCLTGMNKKIAVASKTPGCTQTIDMFKCKDKEGDICMFVDLPGYGFAKMAKTQQDEVSGFLRGYLRNRPSLRLVTLLVDSRREVQDLDLQMIKFMNNEGLPYLIVSTKVDKLSSNEIQQSNAMFSSAFGITPKKPVAFSSVTGAGKKEVWAAIRGGILGDASFLSCNYEDDEDEEDDEEGDENTLDNEE